MVLGSCTPLALPHLLASHMASPCKRHSRMWLGGWLMRISCFETLVVPCAPSIAAAWASCYTASFCKL